MQKNSGKKNYYVQRAHGKMSKNMKEKMGAGEAPIPIVKAESFPPVDKGNVTDARFPFVQRSYQRHTSVVLTV